MSSENVQPLLSSYALSSRFANGPRELDNRLQPPVYQRIATLSVSQQREEKCPTTLDWGTKSWSYLLPQSLQVISSAFLVVDLPQLAEGTYRKNPGLYVLKNFRLLSAGTIVYEMDFDVVMRDNLESHTEAEFRQYCKTHLGYESSPSNEARTIWLPLFLPNTHVLLREGYGNRGTGVFPCRTGNQRVEIQITMHEANQCTSDSAHAVASINTACRIAVNEVRMSQANMEKFSDARGSYSTISRRFTDMSDWTVGEANVKVSLSFNSPIGSISEIQVLCCPWDVDPVRRDIYNTVLPKDLKLTCDSIVVRNNDSKSKIRLENYRQGFVNVESCCSEIARLNFGSHSSENSHKFTGCYSFGSTSNVKIEFTPDVKVWYKLVSVALQAVQIDSSGTIHSFLE
jgi:hypothetical protein